VYFCSISHRVYKRALPAYTSISSTVFAAAVVFSNTSRLHRLTLLLPLLLLWRSADTVHKPGYCSAAAGFMTVTALGFAHLVLPSLKADWVSWSCGIWRGCGVHPPEFVAAAVQALNSADPRNIFWQPPTKKSDGEAIADSPEDAAVTAGFRALHSRIMPAHQLTADLYEAARSKRLSGHRGSAAQGGAAAGAAELYVDKLHFRPDAYREMNTLLLNMLAWP
jgi:hypothetical protein